ncbi:ABC-three component system protein [Actinomadura kijaniata]|uniref:ABC-three component system protein n=1 Tax=Actinomadura kijaniata TaxID=46161 RepID=UPI003F1C864D
MLHDLTSDLPAFRPVRFGAGLNVAVAHRPRDHEGDDRDPAGGTGLVRLLDFLLGGDVRVGHPLRRAELTGARFALTLDLSGRPATITRGAADPATARIDDETMRLQRFRAHLGRALFGLTGEGNEPSFRAVVPYYLRDVAAGGYASPVETRRGQRATDAQPALAHLFALDVDLVAKAREVGETDRQLRALRRAAKESIMGMTLGRLGDLDARIRALRAQRAELAADLAAFRLADRYARHRDRADALSRRIREINDHLAVTERRIRDIEAAIADDAGDLPDHAYLRQVYEQAGAVLPDLVTRRFEEVRAFHRSVVANRRRYLESQHDRLRHERERERAELDRLDRERAEVMRLLDADGALDAYTELHRRLAHLDGRLAELAERRAVVARWSEAGRQVRHRSGEIERRIGDDLHDRRDRVAAVSRRYASYARRLYGARRTADLTIEAGRSGYRFLPSIGGNAAPDGRAMALFCFDLCLAVTARRSGHGPDFLVHDSHLFDHVDARRTALALELAADVGEREGLQYVVTLDSGRLDEALAHRPGLRHHVCAETAGREGGLFGIGR